MNSKVSDIAQFSHLSKVNKKKWNSYLYHAQKRRAIKVDCYLNQNETIITDIADFLNLDLPEFIIIAYETLLQRVPDDEGFDHYYKKLKEGKINRIQLLKQLRFSKEGKKQKANINFLKFFIIEDLFQRKLHIDISFMRKLISNGLL